MNQPGSASTEIMRRIVEYPWRFAVLVLAGFLPAAVAFAAELHGGGQQQEYFVRQAPQQGLLVRIDGREAQFQSRISTIDDEVLVASSVPGSRLAPLFQYLGPVDRARQLDIRVLAPLDTNRSSFRMGLSRVEIRDDRSRRLAQGYQSLSFGLELPSADTAANWSVKVNAHVNAARLFDDFGMVELSLWARYYAAQLSLLELGDHNAALFLIDEVLGDQGLRRFDRLRLAALRLRAEARVAQRGAGELPAQRGAADPVQQAGAEVAALAASLGDLYERSEALLLSGTDLAVRGNEALALERLEEALTLADSIEADDLATRIRERLVSVHGTLGDVAASSEVLQAIGSQLAEDGADDELALNLLAQGRILNQTYRYGQARDVLQQALSFEHNSLTRDRIRLELATASYESGQLDAALAHAGAVVFREDGTSFRRATPALDIERGIGILAATQRALGNRTAMREAREAQRAYLENQQARWRWNWERAQDELVSGPTAAAAPWLRQLLGAAGDPQMAPYAQQAQLWLCLVGTDCPAGAAQGAAERLRGAAFPRHRVAGAWLYAQLLATGRLQSAAEAYDALLSELFFLRLSVPGVLGNWYWRRQVQLTDQALTVYRRLDNPPGHLLTLARVRWLQASSDGLAFPFDPRRAGLDTDSFRAALARVENPEPGDDRAALGRELRTALDDGRARFAEVTGFLDATSLAQWLASLTDQETLLAFDLAPARAYALLGTRRGVERVALPSGERWQTLFTEDLLANSEAGERLRSRWGTRLWGPLADRLSDRVYLGASGALALLPLERLGRPARTVLGDRELIRLASFPFAPAPAARLQPLKPKRVFLAGHPEDFSAGFAERFETGQELAAVLDRFRGPDLQLIQGAALLPDEFATASFAEAALIHLAVPVRIPLNRAGRAYLELSEARGGEGRVRQYPRDLAGWQLRASLTVLSQGDVTLGSGVALVRPPLVADLLAAGSGAVLLAVETPEEALAATYFATFYQALEEGLTMPAAVQAAGRGTPGESPAPVPPGAMQLWLD